MSWWDQIVQNFTSVFRPKARQDGGPALAGTWPTWETSTPQYPTPNPYQAAVQGYRKNEIIYACIQRRAISTADAPACIYERATRRRDTPSQIDDHPARLLLARPNEAMSETEFWQAVSIYMDVAGYSVWECEYSNAGEPIALWPMRPDYCSFLRGDNRPLRAVRYQYPGLPFVDVPVERLVVFADFDPIYPMIKGLSKCSVASRIVATDNAATDFMTTFFQRGAIISGILKTQQSLSDAEAMRIRQRWKDIHGSTGNWGDIAVLGAGTDYQPVQMTFKDMDFSSIDGRDEARICTVFGVPPILLGTKVGLSASTYSNSEQARKAFYEETITPRWSYFSDEITTQLLPKFGISDRTVICKFDTSDVKALQEDRTARFTRAIQAATAQVLTRDEARQEMGFDPIDDVPVFLGSDPPAPGEETVEAEEPEPMPVAPVSQGAPVGVPQSDAGVPEPEAEEPEEAVEDTLKAWRKAAIEAIKAGQPIPVSEDATKKFVGLSEDLRLCKSSGDVRRAFDKHWPKEPEVRPDAPVDALIAEIHATRVALEMSNV